MLRKELKEQTHRVIFLGIAVAAAVVLYFGGLIAAMHIPI